jgi:hypothetical protein
MYSKEPYKFEASVNFKSPPAGEWIQQYHRRSQGWNHCLKSSMEMLVGP